MTIVDTITRPVDVHCEALANTVEGNIVARYLPTLSLTIKDSLPSVSALP